VGAEGTVVVHAGIKIKQVVAGFVDARLVDEILTFL
jgi:hypothetical protein